MNGALSPEVQKKLIDSVNAEIELRTTAARRAPLDHGLAAAASPFARCRRLRLSGVRISYVDQTLPNGSIYSQH